MNKKLKVLLIIIMYIGLILINTKAYGTTGKMINDTTRLRKEASTSSDILALVSLGEEVEIIAEEGDWYKVTYKDKTGYIRKDMISVDESSKETISTENTTSENINVEENTVTEVATQETNTLQSGYAGKLTSNLEIKIVPSINSSVIATIATNTSFKIKDVMNKWCYIETENTAGWALISKVSYEKKDVSSDVNNENETIEEETKNEENKDETEGKEQVAQEEEKTETTKQIETSVKTTTKYVSTTTLNLRENPENDAKIIAGLKQNTEVTVIEEIDNTWSKVTANGKTGYVASKYLSDKKVTTTTRGESEARTSNSNTSTSSSNGASIVAYAKQFLGNPYVYGGTSLTNGCDCSGFVMSVYAHFGYSLPHSSTTMQSVGTAVEKKDLQPGDIVCFSGHVGIYIGNNQFIHAANATKGIIITSLSDSYYTAKYICARRVLN